MAVRPLHWKALRPMWFEDESQSVCFNTRLSGLKKTYGYFQADWQQLVPHKYVQKHSLRASALARFSISTQDFCSRLLILSHNHSDLRRLAFSVSFSLVFGNQSLAYPLLLCFPTALSTLMESSLKISITITLKVSYYISSWFWLVRLVWWCDGTDLNLNF